MIDKAIFKLPGIKHVLILLMGLTLLRGSFVIVQAYSLSIIISELWAGATATSQIPMIIIFFISFFLRQLILFIQDKFMKSYSDKRADELREQLLEKMLADDSSMTKEQGTGKMTNMVIGGIEQVRNYLYLIFPKLIAVVLIPVLLLIAVYYYDWVSGLVLTITVPIIIVFMIILGYAAQKKALKKYKTFQLLSNHFIDSLRGIDTLKLFGISGKHAKSIYEVSEKHRKSTMNTLKIATLSGFALDFFSTLSVAIVAVFLGIRLMNGEIFLFPALMALILSPEYFLAVRNFSADYHATLDGKNSVSEIVNLLNTPDPIIDQVSLGLWNEESTIELDGVYFSYNKKSDVDNYDDAVLKNISFDVTGLKKIGIIGMSGSGKSTLVSILSGMASPDIGSIVVDGKEISSLKQDDWLRQILYIPQSPYIFHGSLRENIAFYKPDSNDLQIQNAVNVSGLNKLVSELPEGLNTVIGEGSRSLSGGEAQRVALARAFIDEERRVLFFDEPTAHLDIENEMELKKRMLPLMENRLVFFATHRLHWMNEMDYILDIKDGQIFQRIML